MEYILTVIWTTGEKEEHTYATEQEAQSAGNGYKIAFGNQIAWVGTRRK